KAKTLHIVPSNIVVGSVNSEDTSNYHQYRLRSLKDKVLLIRFLENMLSRMRCLPPLLSSNFGLEILMSNDETIDFEDFLN
ncbi:28381_t:CDS:2, partial [Dentiscutata erythropus]